MYDELITAIRKTACQFKECGMCPKGKEPCIDRYALQAADAIEGLSKLANAIPHKCECCIGCEIEQKNGGCDNGFVLSPKRAMNYIKELNKPRWIPVTERLPEKFDSVLVVYVGFNDHIPRANMLAYIDGDGDWCWWDDDIPSGIPCTVEITHWMPLPEPPKEDN